MSTDRASEGFASLFESEAEVERPQRRRTLQLGHRCRAQVVHVGRDVVFAELVDPPPVGKREQVFLKYEDVRGPDGQINVKLGETIEAVVVEINSESGEIRLGRTMGKPAGLDELINAHAAGVAVEGKVAGVNKGGLDVEIAGLHAFCPISQADRTFVTDAQALIGRTLQFVVTEVGEGGKRVVVSRRKALEREAREAAGVTLARLATGAVVRGTVTSVREFGAFVDLGGVEGLIPNMELSHDRGARAGDVLAAGDVVDVQIREIKEGVANKRGEPTTKITLSLKALAADPWDQIDTHAQVGKVVRGTIMRMLDFGAFVRIAPGVEGLLHVSELGGKVRHPSEVLKVGETLNVAVRSIDRAAHKIALTPAPDGLEVGADATGPRITIGSVVSGTVDRIEPFGIFLQIEGTRGRAGRGLIPNAELGTARGADTRKLFPIGARLSAKVLETGDGKLRMSIRAIKDDEERADFDGYRASTAASTRFGTFGDLLKKK
jgi:small subunit ribosomal protein S1